MKREQPKIPSGFVEREKRIPNKPGEHVLVYFNQKGGKAKWFQGKLISLENKKVRKTFVLFIQLTKRTLGLIVADPVQREWQILVKTPPQKLWICGVTAILGPDHKNKERGAQMFWQANDKHVSIFSLKIIQLPPLSRQLILKTIIGE